MLNPQLFEMIEHAESRGVSTNITSSGTLIRENIDNIFDSGLREIAFGVYDKRLLLRNLAQIEEFLWEKRRRGSKRPKAYLDITMYKDNLAQILDVVTLASELQVDAVILHRLFNLHKVDPGIECLSVEEEEELFAEVERLAKKLRLEIYLPPKHTLPCRVVKRCIFVTAEGKVTPCCYLPELYLGDAFNEGVGEIMRSKAYRDFVKNMNNHSICSQCRW
jgi:MoaA/NifB/PqqE/SkfB family radical SAM enzyme